ncbi:MAG: efflux RND transporter periplasmic adaptor subunit [Cyanobacteria bacterium P01_H01_bin.105]
MSYESVRSASTHRKNVADRSQRWLSSLTLCTALGISLISTSCRGGSEANAAFPPMPVKLEKLQADTVKESTEFVGTLEAVQIVDVRAETQGRVEQVLVEPGQSVGVGQGIAVLKPDQTVPEYEGALAGVDVAQSQQETAQAKLKIAQTQRDTAQAEFDLISDYIPRLQKLYEQGAIEQLRLDEALQQQAGLQSKLIAAEEEVVVAQLAIQQAQDSLRQSQAQANASLIGVQFKEIVSPIGGVVGDLSVKLGDYVGTGDSVTTVSQTEALFLNLAIPANRSAQLETGLAVELVDPTSNEQLATGSLTFVSPTVDPEGQTVLAKARFRNVDGNLRDGQNVQARLIWDTEPGVLIPTTAITRVGGKDFVFVVGEEPNEEGQEVVRLSPVELGDIQGDSYPVLDGLSVGDRIAVSNILKLRDGAPIQPDSSETSES